MTQQEIEPKEKALFSSKRLARLSLKELPYISPSCNFRRRIHERVAARSSSIGSFLPFSWG
jgi:hypothetical protein